jgi:hypothetical protein
LVSDSTQRAWAEERQVRLGFWAAQTCRGRKLGRAPKEGGGRQSRLKPRKASRYAAVFSMGEGRLLVNLYPSPKTGWIGKPTEVSVLPCSNIVMRPLGILI